MNEAFVSADTWAKSDIKKKWFNLSEGEYFKAQIFDKNLFLVSTVTFANNGILEASLSLGRRVYYMQFREFLSENNFQIKIKKSQQPIYELLRKNNGGLKKDATIELHDYFNQVKKQGMVTAKASTDYTEAKEEILKELTIKEFAQAIDSYAKEYTSKIKIPSEITQVFLMLIREIGVYSCHRILSALCATYSKEPGINMQHLDLIAKNTPSKIRPDANLASLLKEFKEKSYINYSQFEMGKNITFFKTQCFDKEEIRGIHLFVYKGKKTSIIKGSKNITVKKLRSALMSPEDLVKIFLDPPHIPNHNLATKRARELLDIKSTNKTRQKKSRLSARSTQQRVGTSKHGKPHTTTAKTRCTQHKRVQEQINPAKTKEKPYRSAKRAQSDKHEQKLQKNLAGISEKELITSVDKYLKMNALPISSQKVRTLDPKADKSSIDLGHPPMINIVLLQAQSHDYKERIILTRLLQDILTGKLDKNPRALELKEKIFEQCGIDNDTNIRIQLSIMNHGHGASYEFFIRQR